MASSSAAAPLAARAIAGTLHNADPDANGVQSTAGKQHFW